MLAILPVVFSAAVNRTPIGAAAPDEDFAAIYKTKCSVCHSPKVAKFFDDSKADDVLVETVMKGRKGETPPYMPSFKAKGMTQEQATALVTFMKQLKKQSSETNTN